MHDFESILYIHLILLSSGYAPASGLFTPVSSGLYNTVNSTPLSLTPQQSGYGGAFVGGSSTPSASFGSGNYCHNY